LRKTEGESVVNHLNNYVLDENGQPVLEPDIMRWGQWFEKSWPARQVASTEIGDARVSTVFLGFNHNWHEGPPILFETMIFGGEHDQFQRRYFFREEALAAHDQIVAALRDGQDPEPW
jgi:hypothetical protein